MRVVSGKYKGKRFSPPKKFPSRPTTDFAKESLFNILENRIYWEDTKVLDLFAGTGNISIEFLSRGSQSVLSIDKHPVCIRHLNAMQNDLADENWRVIRKDVFQFVEDEVEKFDLVFADPPFGLKGVESLPDMIMKNKLAPEGLLIIEHGQETSFKNHPKLEDERSYGGVFFSFFRE